MMRGLWLKRALIFVGAVVAVMIVATAVTAVVIGMGENDRMVAPLARNIAMSTEFFAAREGGKPPPPPRSRYEIVDSLPLGVERPELTAALQRALLREGEARTVEVIETPEQRPVAAVLLDDGRYMVIAFVGPPIGLPATLLAAPFAWLGVTLVGVSAVALILARRVTEPFILLEQAVASVGPDGILPRVPETGGTEARRTAASLNALSDRLKAAKESRMRLVAAAGHDLRTPMTRMRLRVEFLDEGERSAWQADLDELDAIADSAIGLVKEEGAGEDGEPVALDRLVGETVRELQDAGLAISLDQVDPATVTAGPLALRRALRNLMTNAATHGEGGRVHLALTEEEALLTIDDNGPGIPEHLISQVFEPFFRVDPARTQATKGAGLGLAIAREIVERFGGTIEISNRPEGGLRQLVHLRLAEPA